MAIKQQQQQQHLLRFISFSLLMVLLSLAVISARPIDIINMNHGVNPELTRPNLLGDIASVDISSDNRNEERDIVGQITNISRRSSTNKESDISAVSSSSPIRGLLQPEQPFERGPSSNALSALLSDLENGRIATSDISNAVKRAKEIIEPNAADVKTGLASTTAALTDLLASLDANSKHVETDGQDKSSSSGPETLGTSILLPPPPSISQQAVSDATLHSFNDCM
ncbi:hypothetical protein BDF22DRAFT_692832, partial [Syncephalis plumigaleata]